MRCCPGQPSGDFPEGREDLWWFPGEVEGVPVKPHSVSVLPGRRSAYLVEALRLPSRRVHEVRLAQTEDRRVREGLVQVGVVESVGLLHLVLGVDDGERSVAVAGAYDEVG